MVPDTRSFLMVSQSPWHTDCGTSYIIITGIKPNKTDCKIGEFIRKVNFTLKKQETQGLCDPNILQLYHSPTFSTSFKVHGYKDPEMQGFDYILNVNNISIKNHASLI